MAGPTPPGSQPPSGRQPGRRALSALLGPTRAAVLLIVAHQPDSTTNELAEGIGVSAATISHHTAVLRSSGLITTRRSGGSVHHSLAVPGEVLLSGGGGAEPCT
ncbi:ArsR/SmtB family transcription factor [Streptomyces sp. NPDC057067]|uniref:ArsR family transcriptional regulator n=1 Tax=Streptomyces sp. gb1(2016) TaxID=1828321 RepID=A0A652LET7_9ACTN|nr:MULTISPECIES: winged helix-turn-helix domain-containing protein [Streptomyces]MBL1288103.1 winged helix-turn-helix transcriptional regulator [Streptomyces silvae]TXS34287.1 ArsR family transcriptional regulator [Streptomyces sp. gb1(2016)]